MATVNNRSGKLYIDFRYLGQRCREQTKLPNTAQGRKSVNLFIKKMDREIALGTFKYRNFFPASSKLTQIEIIESKKSLANLSSSVLFNTYAKSWFEQKKIEWRNTQIKNVQGILDIHLLPIFGNRKIEQITRHEILTFRKQLSETKNRSGDMLSNSRINHIMAPLKMILEDAAETFNIECAWRKIKQLPISRAEIKPFSLQEIEAFLKWIRPDYYHYYVIRFFTGMRTGEIDGLHWKDIDFEQRKIHITQSFVDGEYVPPKHDSSYRSIAMSQRVYDSLLKQMELSYQKSENVFCTVSGSELSHRNVSKRIWYPTLKMAGLTARNPYQTRHTTASLWLSSGESPEWIANQMGHANTQMLFKVYSRYVPNHTQSDGRAFENMLNNNNLQYA